MTFSSSRFFIFPILALLLFGAGCSNDENEIVPPVDQKRDLTDTLAYNDMPKVEFRGVLPQEEIARKQVRIKTEKGDIVFALFDDTAPLTVSNFVALTNDGFYNGLTFHRREEGFVIQGGDPNGNGTGGPGYAFQDELKDQRNYSRGIVAMANRGPNTNGSQFFIMLSDYPLPKQYTIFGEVLSGMEAVDAIKVGDKMLSVTVEERE